MSFSNGWWSDFFHGAVADVQRRMNSAEHTAADARLAVDLIRVEPPAKVLDVPCGTGRVAVELAALGYDVTGVDLTAEYLADARVAAESRGVEITLRESDMRDLPWRGQFDAAICVGNSFGYFERSGNAEFVAAVQRTLRPGGVFVLQTYLAAESILPKLRGRYWATFDDVTFLHDPVYDPRRGVIETGYTFLRGGEADHRQAVYQVYMLRELLALMEAAGFVEIEALGGKADEPFALGSDVLHLRAVKPQAAS
ncbi:MAG: methyltransferase domain-containing protein [Pirellulales bacterium]